MHVRDSMDRLAARCYTVCYTVPGKYNTAILFSVVTTFADSMFELNLRKTEQHNSTSTVQYSYHMPTID